MAWACLILAIQNASAAADDAPDVIRFATFNTSLHRSTPGALVQSLSSPHDEQARSLAEIIQRVRPHVLVINELDYDEQGLGARLLQQNYLAVSQNGQQPIEYAFRYVGPVNTGIPTGHDLDGDGQTDGRADAFGFGAFPGQFGMAVYSMLPIESQKVRTFQKFLWKDMPGALLPVRGEGDEPFYSSETLALLRLSSKSHWDVPLARYGHTIHLLVFHPTPPIFDGPEDRNGRRNHDEIRFVADYIDPNRSAYIYDDQGTRGGLSAGAHFVIAGDLNADPQDGEQTAGAIGQLLSHTLIDASVFPTSGGGPEQARLQGEANLQQKGNPAHDTADFNDRRPGNLCVDYVLPSRTLKVVGRGIYWPRSDEEGFQLVGASDHRLVWTDVRF
jgi:hypothetical protein